MEGEGERVSEGDLDEELQQQHLKISKFVFKFFIEEANIDPFLNIIIKRQVIN